MGQDILMTGRAGPPVMYRKRKNPLKCDSCANKPSHVKSGGFSDSTAKAVNAKQKAHVNKIEPGYASK